MKTLFSTVLISVLALGFVLAASSNNAEAWHRSAFSFSVVVPFGVSAWAPAPYYYPSPVYAAPYPVYSPYYGPYFYGPYFRFGHFRHVGHRGFRGDLHGRRHWRQ